MRIGFGYDVHPTKSEGRMILGGILVSEEIGVIAHSDGDVLCHALIDAILGVCGMGDIGRLFPEDRNEGMNSLEALREVVEMALNRGFKLINVDATVVLSKPRLEEYGEKIRENLKFVLRCENVSVKFKSGNGVGEVGRGKAIEAFAVVLVER